MTTRKVKHNGNDHDVVTEQRANGKCIVRIDPSGGTRRYIRQPDVRSTDANTGKTTTTPGPLV